MTTNASGSSHRSSGGIDGGGCAGASSVPSVVGAVTNVGVGAGADGAPSTYRSRVGAHAQVHAGLAISACLLSMICL